MAAEGRRAEAGPARAPAQRRRACEAGDRHRRRRKARSCRRPPGSCRACGASAPRPQPPRAARRSISRARPESAPRQATRPPLSATRRFDGRRAGTLRPYRAPRARSGRSRAGAGSSPVPAAPQGGLQLLLERARLRQSPNSPVGKRNSRAGLEMMLERGFHEIGVSRVDLPLVLAGRELIALANPC